MKIRVSMILVLLSQASMVTQSQLVPDPELPTVQLKMPTGTASELAHINYFMSGQFGGIGNFVSEKKNQESYVINASAEGKPATRIKVIVYIPGCELTTLDLTFETDKHLERQLECHPLPTVTFIARLDSMPESDKPLEIAVFYLADWDHPFFGIMDGMVTMIPIAVLKPLGRHP
ncbi:MAG: hypothetical protein JWO13_2365 [Acidobacteriales bacterium]|nr:hypothetical protein [Terriglobales bacterium]